MCRAINPILLLALVLLAGCTQWSPKGQGGLAEHYSARGVAYRSDQPLGIEDGLRFELDLVRHHLDVLVLEGAELCFPATVVQAKQREQRIDRALTGGLDFDGANDLIVQRGLLQRLEAQLDYVKQQGGCTLAMIAPQASPGALGRQLDELLNSDNQFALNSSALNPKYIGHLAAAIPLLQAQPAYQLEITGHADATGGEVQNQALSLARAQQVARYLQALGLEKKRMRVKGVAADHPLFKGGQAEVRLTNRRVTISLIEGDQYFLKTGE